MLFWALYVKRLRYQLTLKNDYKMCDYLFIIKKKIPIVQLADLRMASL